MFRNLRVGAKLVAIVAPPLVVLAVLAGLGVADRLDRAAEAQRAQRVIDVVAVAGAAGHAGQIEQAAAAVLAGSDGELGRDRYQQLVTRTDAAYGDLRARLDAAGSLPGAADRLRVLDDRLAALPELRARVLSGAASLDDVVDGYGLLGTATSGLYDFASGQDVEADVSADIGFAGTLAKAKASRADALALLAGGVGAQRALPEELVAAAQDRLAQAERRYLTFFEQADSEFRALLRNNQANGAARANDAAVAVLTGAAEGEAVSLETLLETGETRLGDELVVLAGIASNVDEEVARARAEALAAVRAYLVGAALAIVVALGLALLVARSVARRLRQLTGAAQALSSEQLPALVERLRAPDADLSAVTPEPIAVKGRDEIAALAASFNDIQRVAVSVAEEQSALLRKGISDLFINLARRNHALLDRQISFIDDLESVETDADQLDNLFRLDHLATRMRRNAESLLVLAGAESARRRGRPSGLDDVVRTALGEVEDFTRIEIVALDDVAVPAGMAVDLAHLLAELLENAAQFSPPDTTVEVAGHRHHGDGYVLSISDQGIGMTREQLAALNAVLAAPPATGLALGRSLGAIVVGRLAARHGIEVRLDATKAGGVVALVTLPAALLVAPAVTGEGDAEVIDLTEARAAKAATPSGDAMPRRDSAAVAAAEAAPAEVTAAGAELVTPGAATAAGGAVVAVVPAAKLGEHHHKPLQNVVVRRLAPRPTADGGDAFTYLDLDDQPVVLAPTGPATTQLRAAASTPPPAVPGADAPGTAAFAAAAAAAAEEAGSGAATTVIDLSGEEPLPRRRSGSGGRGEGAEVADLATLAAGDAGLPRRSGRQQVRDLREGGAVDPGYARVAASQRTPEEVRRMLSRYRTGLQQARSEVRPESAAAAGEAGGTGRADTGEDPQ
jgi:signal transduction histidine kinase